MINSGVFVGGTLDAFTEDGFDTVFNVNAKGTFFSAQESAKIMRDGGRIVFISSGITHEKIPGVSAYAATKAAVNQYARVFAIELGPRKITVNAVSPGYTETVMLPDAMRPGAAAASPFNRIGSPDDIANAVDFIVSEAGAWVSGTDFNVSGAAALY